MKGLVFLHCGLPLSWPELGPRAWEGGVGRTWGLPPLLAPEAGLPFTFTGCGHPLWASTTQVEMMRSSHV